MKELLSEDHIRTDITYTSDSPARCWVIQNSVVNFGKAWLTS